MERIWGRRLLVLCGVSAALALSVPGLARAASYHVTAGGLDSGSSLCPLGTFESSTPVPAEACSGVVWVGAPTLAGTTVPYNDRTFWQITAPSGLSLDSIQIPDSSIDDGSGEWSAGDFWQGAAGPGTYAGDTWTESGEEYAPSIDSPFYAVQLICVASAGCPQEVAR